MQSEGIQPNMTNFHPRIVTKVLETSHRLSASMCDKERLCYLVSDEEWNQLCRYASQFEVRQYLFDEKITSMQFAGIEVIKRSAVTQTKNPLAGA
jgi:hypothetical protein